MFTEASSSSGEPLFELLKDLCRGGDRVPGEEASAGGDEAERGRLVTGDLDLLLGWLSGRVARVVSDFLEQPHLGGELKA